MKYVIGFFVALILAIILKKLDLSSDFLNGWWCCTAYFLTVMIYDEIKNKK